MVRTYTKIALWACLSTMPVVSTAQGVAGVRALPPVAAVKPVGAQISSMRVPTISKWSDLTSGTYTDMQVLSVQEAVSANVIPLLTNVRQQYTRRILVRRFMAYKLVPTQDGRFLRYSAGIRWVVDVATKDVSTEVSFPSLAAQAQLGTAFAMAKVETVGINYDAINRVCDVPAELNVDNYVRMSDAFDKARNLLTDDVKVDAVIADIVQGPNLTSDSYSGAVATTWALSEISGKKKLAEAAKDCPINSQAARDVIESVYRNLCGTTDQNYTPDDVAQAMARQELSGVKVHR